MTPDDLRQWAVSPYVYPQTAIIAAADAWEREREELDRERVRLAACGTAAIATVEGRITSDNPYYSASYADVCAAVDREMALRKRVKELEAKLVLSCEATRSARMDEASCWAPGFYRGLERVKELEALVREGLRCMEEAKKRWAPTTTNSDADVWIDRARRALEAKE